MNGFASTESNWHIVYTQKGLEKRIHNDLLSLEIESFCPCHYIVRQWSDRKKKVETPLFPNYVFVNITPRLKLRVLSIPGVIKLLHRDGKPERVRPHEIELIKKIQCSDNIQVTDQRVPVKGDRVKINYGMLNGVTGEYVTTKGRHKFLIRLDCLNRSVLLEIPGKFLECVHKRQAQV